MNIDNFDKKILRALQQNGRLSNVELAAKVGLSESPCLRRVRTLENNGIIKAFKAVLDHNELGLGVIAYIHINLDQSSESSVAAFKEEVMSEPSVIECYALTGDFDFLLKVAAKSLEDFGTLTMQKILRYPGVNTIKSSVSLEVIKESAGYPVY